MPLVLDDRRTRWLKTTTLPTTEQEGPVAVLIGGALLGVVGALVAIPVAAAVQLLVREVVFPRMDEV